MCVQIYLIGRSLGGKLRKGTPSSLIFEVGNGNKHGGGVTIGCIHVLLYSQTDSVSIKLGNYMAPRFVLAEYINIVRLGLDLGRARAGPCTPRFFLFGIHQTPSASGSSCF